MGHSETIGAYVVILICRVVNKNEY